MRDCPIWSTHTYDWVLHTRRLALGARVPGQSWGVQWQSWGISGGRQWHERGGSLASLPAEGSWGGGQLCLAHVAGTQGQSSGGEQHLCRSVRLLALVGCWEYCDGCVNRRQCWCVGSSVPALGHLLWHDGGAVMLERRDPPINMRWKGGETISWWVGGGFI